MKKLFALIFLLSSSFAFAQQSTLKGIIVNEEGNPLIYATAVLLSPSDSTMSYYGVSNENGEFLMKNIKKGSYILQTGFMGYQSYFLNIDYPIAPNNDVGVIAMLPKSQFLDEVEISGNRIPILIKKKNILWG